MSDPESLPPHFDPFTRWWASNVGGLPTPDDVRKFKPRLERQGLLRSEENFVRNAVADALVTGTELCAPWKAQEELNAARARGLDLSSDPAFQELEELERLGLARKGMRSKRKDPKALLKASSHRAEKLLRKGAALKTPPGTSAKSRSKVRRAKPARDEARDRKILEEIHSYLKVGVPIRFTSKQTEVVSPAGNSDPADGSPRTVTHDPVIWLPHWEKASLPLRAMAMGIAAGQQGAIDFTLHLGDSGIAYAMGIGEMHFARRMYRRIKDALERECPRKGFPAPEFFFLVEQGVGERPHAHGVMLVPANKSHQKRLRTILRNVAGTDWKPTGRDKTQVEFGSLFEPSGWVNYITKYTEMTMAVLGENIFASSRSITRAGHAWYNIMRDSRGPLLPGKAVKISSH